MPVTQRDITVYAKRQAAINKSKKKQEDLSKAFRAQLDSGQALPDDGPYVLELSSQGGKQLDWKEELRIFLIEKNAKRHGVRMATMIAEQELARLEAAAPPNEPVEVLGKSYVGGYKLQVRANPTYRNQQRVA